MQEVAGVCVRNWYAMNAGCQPYLPSRWSLGRESDWYRVCQLKRTNELVMTTEGACPNQFYRPPRIAGRHPPVSEDGRHGYTNLAFWDGHVRAYNSLRFDHNLSQPFLCIYEETIFYFHEDFGTR
jgi:prepilin-type processing-associated H-X9-DG protein